jgi:hypothetical protein
MTTRIIYIIVGSLVVLGLILGIWFWFFGRGGNTAGDLGSFGSGGDKTSTSTGLGDDGGNGQAPIGSTTSMGVTPGSGTNNIQTFISSSTGPVNSNDIPYVNLVDSNTIVSPDVVWNDSAFNGGGGSSVVFNPSPITAVQGGDISGTPYIPTTIGADGKPVSLLGGLGAVLGGCVLNYVAVKGVSTFGNLLGSVVDLAKVQVADTNGTASTDTGSIMLCLVRTLGKIAVQQITNSTVNWINSGFNGKPAYVQDYNKFFANVADQAAGSYLQSSGFAFLCSPFQLQVKIAVAQSYARRNNAPSCTLTQAVGNVESFLNGDFSQGGWGGLISFTTESGNNPFAAFMTLSGGLQNAEGQAQANATLDINLGKGFLSQTKCDSSGKNCTIITPGSVIEASLESSIDTNIKELAIGDSINEILAALQNALVSKILGNGLFNTNKASANNSVYAVNPAQTAATNLINEIRGVVTSAQQYGSVEQRTITDIQAQQQGLTTLLNCWLAASSSVTLTPSQVASARTEGDAATQKIYQLQALIDLHNQNITTANNSIANFQELQTGLILANTPADVTEGQNTWSSIKATDLPHVYTGSDVISAQQDRASTQSNLTNINTETSAKLQQCYALEQ